MITNKYSPKKRSSNPDEIRSLMKEFLNKKFVKTNNVIEDFIWFKKFKFLFSEFYYDKFSTYNGINYPDYLWVDEILKEELPIKKCRRKGFVRQHVLGYKLK